MADFNEIVKVAVDAYHGNVTKYSVDQSMDLLQKALVEANGGDTALNYKSIRDGKCNGLFTLIETILDKTVVEGLQESDFFNELVEFRNVALGDKNIFVVEDNDLFSVAEAAEGTQGIRRQRFMGRTETAIETSLKVVKIYEELNRVLAGRVDFNEMINLVADSFKAQMLNEIYGLWSNVTQAQLGGAVYYPAAGAYDEATLLTLIEHVEAAAGGQQVTLLGTKAALRNLAPSIQGADSRSDIYNLGYYGKYFGANTFAIPQRHQIGNTNFVMDDNVITILASGEKPIKCVYEGDPLVVMPDPLTQGDLTQNYLYGSRWGLGLILPANSGIGIYDMTH